MHDSPGNSAPWWGEHRIPFGQGLRWRIGPLQLWIRRLPDEWRIAHQRSAIALDTSLEIASTWSGEEDEHESTQRFAHGSLSDSLRLSAVLADRPVVSRAERPLNVPPGEQVTAFISSPVRLKVEVGKSSKFLLELPTFRQSDTWFGPNTWEGELCYANRTFLRLRLEQLIALPHHAITPVRIRNHSDTMLSLTRMQVPVAHLSLYADADGRLLTDEVIFTRSNSDDFANLRTRPKAESTWTAKAKRLCPPRKQTQENMVVRAFSSIFGE